MYYVERRIVVFCATIYLWTVFQLTIQIKLINCKIPVVRLVTDHPYLVVVQALTSNPMR